MARRKLEWKLDFLALARSSAEGPSIVVAIGGSRVRWFMVQKRKKKTQRSHRVIVRRLYPSSSANQQVLRSLFPRPNVATVSHFAVFVDVDVQLPDGQAAEREKRRKAVTFHCFTAVTFPWHFRCWSLRRNELECTDLVYWTEAWHRFLSRDAIIVVGSMLEKHFDGDFTPNQEKEITFKRWPPGYQSWKLGLALNGLRTKREKKKAHFALEVPPNHNLHPNTGHFLPPSNPRPPPPNRWEEVPLTPPPSFWQERIRAVDLECQKKTDPSFDKRQPRPEKWLQFLSKLYFSFFFQTCLFFFLHNKIRKKGSKSVQKKNERKVDIIYIPLAISSFRETWHCNTFGGRTGTWDHTAILKKTRSCLFFNVWGGQQSFK